MWDVLSGDFDPNITEEQCLLNVTRNVEPGSIVVFHDSLKAEEKLRYALPKALAYLAEQGYRFEALNEQEMVVHQDQRKSA
jgi:peptidoglycan/xylan/chitin deacetylase (PgdA/CDA1 family)